MLLLGFLPTSQLPSMGTVASVCGDLEPEVTFYFNILSLTVSSAFVRKTSNKLADCPAVSLDLCIYTTTNKYPNVKQLSWAIN